jgi:hypothetical protein
MKLKLNLSFFLFFAMACPCFSQTAYTDAIAIQDILRNGSDDPKKAEQIAKLVIPYFVIDGKFERDQIRSYCGKEVDSLITLYLQARAQQLPVVQELARKVSEIKKSFDEIELEIGQVNQLLMKPQYKSAYSDSTLNMQNILAFSAPFVLKNKLNELKQMELIYAKDTTDVAAKSNLNALLGSFGALQNSIQQLTDHNNQIISRYETIKGKWIALSTLIHTKYKSELAKLQMQNQFALFERIEDVPINLSTEVKTNPAVASQMVTLASFKIPTQAEMIDALAIYMAKRFKQEVALSFMASLKAQINRQPLIAEVFPSTVALLQSGEIYELPKMGSTWHYSIARDLTELPLHLQESGWIRDRVKETKAENYYSLFCDAITIGEQVKKGNSLPEIVSLYKSNAAPLKNVYIAMAFEVLNVVDNELVNTNVSDTRRYWMRWQKLNQMTPQQWDTFFNLVGFKYRSGLFNDKHLKDVLSWDTSRKQAFRTYLLKALGVLNQYQEAQITYFNEKERDAKAEYKGMSVWDLQTQLFSVLLDNQIIQLPKNAELTLTMAHKGVEIYKLQQQKNYPAMIHQSIAFLEQMFPKETANVSNLIVKHWRSSKTKYAGDYQLITDSLNSLNVLCERLGACGSDAEKLHVLKVWAAGMNISGNKDEMLTRIATHYYSKLAVGEAKHFLTIKDASHFRELLRDVYETPVQFTSTSARASNLRVVVKTAEFFTDVMSSANSKELASVVEAYAMPANSYKIKRYSRYSLDLNGYVGFYGGGELIDPKAANVKDFAGVWGLSAPIGIALSWGSRVKTEGTTQASFVNRKGTAKTLSGNSFSVSLTLIDIAAPVSYRLSNDAEEALPKDLKWSQVLSPGLQLRWGIRNTPLVLTLGTQYTPQMRNFNDTVNNQQAYRFFGGLFFDLPLFNLYKR